MKDFFRFLKFTFFSISAGLIEMGLFFLLNEFTSFKYWPCYLIALSMSVLWNLTLNRKFTFRSSTNISVAIFKILIYYSIFTPLTTILGNYLVESLSFNEYFVTIFNMILNFVTEYLYQRYVIYNNSIDSIDYSN